MFKKFLFIIICIFSFSCNNQTIYSGKILNQEDLNSINFENKNKLVKKFGFPSYVDPVENKFFYYSEKSQKKSIFKNEIYYSYLFIFSFDKNDKIINSSVYNLKNKKELELVKEQTENQIVRRGLLEKIFGGVGTQQELPTTP